jgi:hypothetical protein
MCALLFILFQETNKTVITRPVQTFLFPTKNKWINGVEVDDGSNQCRILHSTKTWTPVIISLSYFTTCPRYWASCRSSDSLWKRANDTPRIIRAGDCLDNVGSLTSHNPIGLQDLLRG